MNHQSPSPLSPREAVSAAMEDAAVSAFAKTIKLNNVAVHHLERGQPEQAAKVLSTAFYAFKRACHKQKHDLPSLYSTVTDFKTNSNIEDVQGMLLNVADLFSTKKNHRKEASCSNLEWSDDEDSVNDDSSTSSAPLFEDREDGEGEVSMHTSPIHLPVNYPITQESCAFLSTSITFNLALANHLVGLEMCKNGSSIAKNSTAMKHLQSAGRLYEYTIRLERARSQHQQALREAQVHQAGVVPHHLPPSPPLFVSPFVLMAILNNLGHLHWILKNAGQAEKCFRQLQSSMMYMLHIQNKNGSGDSFNGNASSSPRPSSSGTRHPRNHHDMMQTFMGNASLGLGGGVKGGPAAAA